MFCLSVFRFVTVALSFCHSVRVAIRLSLSLFVCLSVNMHQQGVLVQRNDVFILVSPSGCLSVFQSVTVLSLTPSLSQSGCHFPCLSVCLYVYEHAPAEGADAEKWRVHLGDSVCLSVFRPLCPNLCLLSNCQYVRLSLCLYVCLDKRTVST